MPSGLITRSDESESSSIQSTEKGRVTFHSTELEVQQGKKGSRSACCVYIYSYSIGRYIIVQELCESRGGRPGLSVLTSLMVSVDVKL